MTHSIALACGGDFLIFLFNSLIAFNLTVMAMRAVEVVGALNVAVALVVVVGASSGPGSWAQAGVPRGRR
jgi:hypothetical protein